MSGLKKLNSIFQKKGSLSFFNSSVTDLESNLDYEEKRIPMDISEEEMDDDEDEED